MGHEFRRPNRRSLAWCGVGALVLVAIGVYLLAVNLGVAGWISVVFWPLLLIVIGVLILLGVFRRSLR